MSFWDLDAGGTAQDQGTDMEIGTGNFEPIPEGTQCLAIIDEAKWDQDQGGNEFISLRWSVLQPEAYANRKIFQKLWVTDLDPRAKSDAKAMAKRDKALKTLAAIDKNCGGRLTKVADIPSDEDLQAGLMNVPVVIKLGIWEMPDEQNPGRFIDGNWVMMVASPKSQKPDTEGKASGRPTNRGRQQQRSQGRSDDSMDLDDEIPF